MHAGKARAAPASCQLEPSSLEVAARPTSRHLGYILQRRMLGLPQ